MVTPGIRLLGDNVLIKEDPKGDLKKTKGGVFVVKGDSPDKKDDRQPDRPLTGTVVVVGPGTKEGDKFVGIPEVRPGDRVLFSQHADIVDCFDEEYRLASNWELIGVLTATDGEGSAA